ncbi:MAG: sulfatase [Candidatus Eiseniibacteriota bacterium]
MPPRNPAVHARTRGPSCRLIAAAAASAVAAAVAISASACGPAPRPSATNAILVSLDTVRADRLGAFGCPLGTTPHLDRLARGGTQFARCIAQAASTLPSHRALFQSRPASQVGAELPMLAEVLQEAGLRAVAFTGGGNVAGELGFARGFERYEESDVGLGWSVEQLGAFLDQAAGAPFFAFLHGYDAHVPYDPPPPYDRLYDPGYAGKVTGPETRALCRAFRGLDGGEAPTLDEADRRHLVALYDGGIRALDVRFGRLTRLLETRGLDESTLVAVTSDHGEEFWDHGSLLHSHTVHGELVHVPLILAVPGASPRLVGETVRSLDIAPTVLEALGLPPAPSHQGRSLLAAAHGAPIEPAAAPSEMGPWKALESGRWKVIAHTAQGTLSMYDLARDPGETRDVGPANAANAERGAALGRELAALVGAAQVRELDTASPELTERLRALGYVE